MPIAQSSAYRMAVCSLLALIFLSLAWELWLAPLRPGGSWLALKALPLCLLLPGILQRRRQSFLLSGMLVLFYAAEAVVRLFDAVPASRACAMAALAAGGVFFVSCLMFMRSGRKERA
ncbi:hypothetical protein A7P95_02935 [Eikenella longinqua]|uniref:DUF2069 domain-containing protein n=1 Tax=Eikenella longinqua TaxID=1795827 RepID=A0A1A9RZG9_9NEIS|nr:hypothetical protein A7P95_02935 [Eikenella longinqua]